MKTCFNCKNNWFSIGKDTRGHYIKYDECPYFKTLKLDRSDVPIETVMTPSGEIDLSKHAAGYLCGHWEGEK